MKFDCDAWRDLRTRRRVERLWRETEWRSEFAWFPTKVSPRDCRWLETIERRFVPTYVDYFAKHGEWLDGYVEYRACPSAT